ncbi:hypothetical protein Lal_00030339, partial [Lupinus albus]
SDICTLLIGAFTWSSMPPMSVDNALLFINKKFEQFQNEDDARHEYLLKALANLKHKPYYSSTQQPYTQHQILMPSHLRPQGLTHSIPKHFYPHSQGIVALLNNTHQIQSQNAIGKPLIPNHHTHIQPFSQSANTIQSRTLEPVGRQGGFIEQQTDSASSKATELNSFHKILHFFSDSFHE